MKFLIDRCAGRRLADWLRLEGHDVLEATQLGQDPGDAELLRVASQQGRVTVTIDSDFGRLIYRDDAQHAGLIRLPSVPAERRIMLLRIVLERHSPELARGGVVTVRGSRIRVSEQP